MKVLDVGKIFETNYIICILGKPKKRYYFIDTMRGKNKIETIKKIYCSEGGGGLTGNNTCAPGKR